MPSLGRANLGLTGTLAQLLEQDNLFLVVAPDEVRSYREATDDRVSILSCPVQGDIAATRRWIGQWAQQLNFRKFVVMDDDLGLLVRRSPETWQLRQSSLDEVGDMLRTIEGLLDEYAHVGVSAREGNNRAGEGDAPLLQENTRTYRVLAYQTDMFLGVEHGRVRVMEDFDVNLQLLRQGHKNACLFYWAQGQKMTNAPGGCSTWRTHEVHEESARRLAELHPGLVSLREKHNKTDADGFGTRTEVTIQWKRAYNHG